MRRLLNDNGYESAESILNEWNYVKGWEKDFIYSIKTIIGIKGAAFTMACMSAAQHSSIDMLMYYDTRLSPFCGLFDFYTYKPLKGYYPFKWYGMFYDMEAEIKCSTEIKDIYTLCGVDSNNKTLTVITYYTDNDTAENKTVNIDFSKSGKYEIYLLDNEHDAELIRTTDELTFDMKPNTCVLVKEIE